MEQSTKRKAKHRSPSITEEYLKSLQLAFDACQKHLNAALELKEAYLLLEDFAALSVWPWVLAEPGKPPPVDDDRTRGPLLDLEGDIQRALFYAKAGFYDDAGDRLRRFLRHAFWCAAVVNGAPLDPNCDERAGLEALLAEPAFREFEETLELRPRLEEWLVAMAESPKQDDDVIQFHEEKFQKLLACAREAVDLAVTCFAYRKPQVVVPLANTDKFGGYVLWAGLLKPAHVEVILAVLKPQTQEFLRSALRSDPRIEAAREYIRGMPEMGSAEEFMALAMVWKRREEQKAQAGTPSAEQKVS